MGHSTPLYLYTYNQLFDLTPLVLINLFKVCFTTLEPTYFDNL